MSDALTDRGTPHTSAARTGLGHLLRVQVPGDEPAWVACDFGWDDRRTDHVAGPGRASFVIGNPDAAYVFRDATGPTQTVDLTASFAARLAEGGVARFLGNWTYDAPDHDPMGMVTDAALAAGCDVLVVERAVVLPERYARL